LIRHRLHTWTTLVPIAALAIGCAVLAPGCGGLTVSPAGPSTSAETVKSGHPTLLNFQGTNADGGSFKGYIVFGSRDVEGRLEFGRFVGAFWDVTVTGGSQTRDSHFTSTNHGRALIETYNLPEPTIGLVFLWPDADPSLQWFTPHFRTTGPFKPDVPPTLQDFGTLVPGVAAAGISIYRDGQGGSTVVRSIAITSISEWPEGRPPSD
jgi:hypothetical protein